MHSSHKLLGPEDRLGDGDTVLRLVVPADCTGTYEAWLADPAVNQFLETRWSPQSHAAIVAFVTSMLHSPDNYLFAIVHRAVHVGNIKLGPINRNHGFADVSYFIGDRTAWGRGVATRAISLVSSFALEAVGLRRVQAGVYASNRASCRALEKAGFHYEARFERQLVGPNGLEDHLFYCRT